MLDLRYWWGEQLHSADTESLRFSVGGSPHPVIFLLLNLPFGITTGYIIVAVPFLATRAGLPVLTAASIVSFAITPKAWKIFWSPLADMGFTLKTWYSIGAAIAGGMLLLQSLVPLTRSTMVFITAELFVAEFGSSLLSPSFKAAWASLAAASQPVVSAALDRVTVNRAGIVARVASRLRRESRDRFAVSVRS